MPKRRACVTIVVLLVWLVTGRFAAANNGSVAVASEVSGIRIDGDFRDWPSIGHRYHINRNLFGNATGSPQDHEATFRVGFDRKLNHLYVAVEVEDDSYVVDKNSTEWFASDGMGLGIGLEHSDRGVIGREFGIRGESSVSLVTNGGGGKPKIASLAFQLDGTRRRYEWRIDLAALGAKPPPTGPFTCAWFVNINDRDEDGSFSVVYWSPGAYKLLDAERLGDLVIHQTAKKRGNLLGTLTPFRDELPLSHQLVRLRSTDNPRLLVDLQTTNGGTYDMTLPAGVYERTVLSQPSIPTAKITIRGDDIVRDDIVVPSLATTQNPFGQGRFERLGDGKNTDGIQVYSPSDNVPSRSLNAITQDHTGRLWVASQTGLAAVERGQLQIFGVSDGLPSNDIRALLYEPNSDELHVGTSQGFATIELSNWRLVGYPKLAGRAISAIATAHDSCILIGTDAGLFSLDRSSDVGVKRIEPELKLKFTSILADASGTQTWIGTEAGVQIWKNEQLVETDLLSNSFHRRVHSLCQTGDKRLWIGAGAALFRAHGGSAVLVHEAQPSFDQFIYGLRVDRSDRVWAATRDGLKRVEQVDDESESGAAESQVELVTEFIGNRDRATSAVFTDARNAIWAGTRDGRLLHLGRNLLLVDARRTTAVDTDETEELWHATANVADSKYELHRGDSKSWQFDSAVTAIAASSSLPSWLATAKHRLYRLDPGAVEWEQLTDAEWTGLRVRTIAMDRQGTTWIAALDGLREVTSDGRVTKHTVDDGLPNTEVSKVVFDAQNRVYAATLHGVGIYENGKWRTLVGGGVPPHIAQTVLVAQDGTIFVGTLKNGLLVVNDNEIRSYSDRDGLSDVRINQLAADSNGHLWILTPHGVDRFDGQVFQNFRLAEEVGISEIDGFATTKDTTYFASDAGLWSYRQPKIRPTMIIDRVLESNNRGNLRATRSLSADSEHVEFYFHAVSLNTRREDMAYRYRLQGISPGWIRTKETFARFPNPGPGAYEFEVQAIDQDLTRSEIVTAKFGVTLPILRYLTNLTLAFSFASLALVLVAYVNRNRRTKQLLEFRVSERTVALQRETEEREKLQDELHHAAKMEALGTLATGIAHDFNNSLCAISANAELARMQENPDPTREYITEIMHVTELATGLSQSLLTFGGKARSEKRPTNLNKLVRSSMKIIRRTVPSAIEVTLDVPKSPISWCDLDSSQLQQLLMNLAVNARDALQFSGEIRVHVENTETDAGTRNAVIRFCDTGPGIPHEIMERIFEPFVSSKPRGQGTGLGLSIVHAVVLDHDGTIDVKSDAEHGTEFTITLPCIPPPDAHESEHTPSHDFYTELVEGIAIVADDQTHVRRSIASSLKTLGYEVITAGDGGECLERVKQMANALDLIVLDIDMPIMGGIECLEMIREILPQIKVVLVTGLVMESLDDHVDEYTRVLRKPFSLESLAETVTFKV